MERKKKELELWRRLLAGAKTREGAELATRAIEKLTAELEGGE